MKNSHFWFVAATLAVLGAVGCSNERSQEAVENTPENPSVTASTQENEGQNAPSSFDSPPAVGTQAHCPVMGHDFTVTAESLRSEHNGRHYVFCCAACKPRFDENPGQFIGQS